MSGGVVFVRLSENVFSLKNIAPVFVISYLTSAHIMCIIETDCHVEVFLYVPEEEDRYFPC